MVPRLHAGQFLNVVTIHLGFLGGVMGLYQIGVGVRPATAISTGVSGVTRSILVPWHYGGLSATVTITVTLHLGLWRVRPVALGQVSCCSPSATTTVSLCMGSRPRWHAWMWMEWLGGKRQETKLSSLGTTDCQWKASWKSKMEQCLPFREVGNARLERHLLSSLQLANSDQLSVAHVLSVLWLYLIIWRTERPLCL